MSQRKTKKELAKELYIKGIHQDSIAEILGVTLRTIQNYKSTDAEDWDALKTASYIDGAAEQKVNLFESFLEQMHKAVLEINEDGKMKAEDKAMAIARVSEGFTKMLRVASKQDPEGYRLNTIKGVLRILAIEFRKLGKETAEIFLGIIEDKSVSESIMGVGKMD